MKRNLIVSVAQQETKSKMRENLSQFFLSFRNSMNVKVLILLVLPLISFAQNVKIENADVFFKSAQLTNVSRSNEINQIKSLIKDLHPSVYLEKGRVNTYGESPKCLFTDVESISLLKDLRTDLSSIEIVTINIKSQKDLTSIIDLDTFLNYPSIKVIHLNVHFDCTADMLYPMIKYVKSNYTVLYSVEKPS